MCGIAGYIGESKKPVLTQQLITKLLEKSEIRGYDATGFWGTERGEGKVLYHKEPIKSSLFVKKDIWKQVATYNPNLLLVHARGASKGVGEPFHNENNHPFPNSDKSLALVHNGRIEDFEYQALKQKYEPISQCDSEILLRILESGNLYSKEDLVQFGETLMPARLAGIKDIFSFINEGHMAVAVGERVKETRFLWLFRNCFRPLWIVDMRNQLGQIFFVSDPQIWEDAASECSGAKNIARTQKLIELPTEEIWQFSLKDEIVLERFEVLKEDKLIPWEFDGNKIPPIQHSLTFEVVSNLDAKDKLIQPNLVEFKNSSQVVFPDVFTLRSADLVCNDIIQITNQIRQLLDDLITEGSLTQQELNQTLLDLDSQSQDLKGISLILER